MFINQDLLIQIASKLDTDIYNVSILSAEIKELSCDRYILFKVLNTSNNHLKIVKIKLNN